MMRIGSNRVHLVGIGGAGLSALARMLHRAGGEITGSDAVENEVVHALRTEGVEVWSGSHPERVRGENGYVVRSAAVPTTDREVLECERRGFTSLLYAEAVGRLSEGKRTLAIAGTHGKTTTTGMTVAGLRGSGIDPSHLIGGEIPEFGGNGHGGADDVFVVEACEFNRSFHHLRPYSAAVLNLDRDHFDCYPSNDELIEAFAGYVARVRPGGTVFVHDAIPSLIVDSVCKQVRVVRVGEGLFADYRAIDVASNLGCYSFVPLVFGERLPRVELRLPGRFQMTNALFSIGLAQSVGADAAGVARGLSAFDGVRRRFELHTGAGGGVLVNDYAHHPEELRVVLRAARQRFPGKRLLAVFQPHQHERTEQLFDEFADALSLADECIIAEIYGARENGRPPAVTASDLAGAVRTAGVRAAVGASLDSLPALILERRQGDDLIMILGAGDVADVVHDVVTRI
ncbi:MAG: UDP-N-acetylmuramate--L-alanine ligase [Planctomycetes bacterium]|nr:UDP-N-acetylmuramate--L-alanine ligase [Planctomycetota bacterium]